MPPAQLKVTVSTQKIQHSFNHFIRPMHKKNLCYAFISFRKATDEWVFNTLLRSQQRPCLTQHMQQHVSAAPAPRCGFLAASPTAAAPPAARRARIPSRALPPQQPALSHRGRGQSSSQTRGRGEKKRTGFFTQVFTRLTGTPSRPGLIDKRLLTCHFTPAPLRRGNGSS